jgi:hypothetical protein
MAAIEGSTGSISPTLADKDGKRCEVVLTIDEASSLTMTLPQLLKMVLRRRYSEAGEIVSERALAPSPPS